MVTSVKVPKLDTLMEKGIITEWCKKEGEKIAKGEPLLLIVSMKAIVEIEAPASGTVDEILVPEGSEVPVGEEIAIITEPEEMRLSQSKTTQVARFMEPAKQEEEKGDLSPLPEKHPEISPLARRIAKEHNINLANIEGTGPRGRIVKEDIMKAIEKDKIDSESRTTSSLEEIKVAKIIPLTEMKKTISSRLSKSYQNAVHTTVILEVDVSEIIKLRNRILEERKKRMCQ